MFIIFTCTINYSRPSDSKLATDILGKIFFIVSEVTHFKKCLASRKFVY